MTHFVRSRNLPYSVENIKYVTSHCVTCARLKPRYYKPQNPPLIKSTQPFERISIDFKGPLPSTTKNKYMLTLVDEYSRFPFAYPCSNMETDTVIKCLVDLFSVFGTPSSIHSDNGTSLVSEKLRSFFLAHGIAYSNSSVYNPRGNGQVELYNGVIWKTVQLSLHNRNLDICHWESVLPEALHCIRSLLCTSTNQTPHERLFSFQRKSATGTSLPTWLLNNGRVLMKRHVRRSKYEPICDEVDLIAINPSNAKVRLPCGREQTVSLRDLAPLPSHETAPQSPLEISHHSIAGSPVSADTPKDPRSAPVNIVLDSKIVNKEVRQPTCISDSKTSISTIEPRRSTRTTKQPDWIGIEKPGGPG